MAMIKLMPKKKMNIARAKFDFNKLMGSSMKGAYVVMLPL